MLHKIKLACISATVLLMPGMANSTSIDAGLWTEFYSYKQQLPVEQSQLRSLQGMRLGVRDAFVPGLSMFVRGRVANDLSNDLPQDTDLRVFGAYLEYARQNWLTVRAGRQFLSPGISAMTLDGGRIDLSYKGDLQLTGYAGTIPGPSFYDLDRVNSWKDRNAFGGQLKFSGLKPFKVGVAFSQREVNENLDSRVMQFDLGYSKGRSSVLGRIDYDLFYERVRLASVKPRLKLPGGHSLDLEYFYRRPSLPMSNPFSVVSNKAFNQIRVNPVVRITPTLHALGSLSYTRFVDENNIRVSLGAAYRGQSLGGVISEGYGGRRYGVFASLFRDITEQLQGYFYGDMYQYKLDTEEDDTDPSLSTALGVRYIIGKGFSTRAEGQLLSNRDYEYDTRFYLRLAYDLHTSIGQDADGGGSR